MSETVILRLVRNGDSREFTCRGVADVEGHLEGAWDSAIVRTVSGEFELIDGKWVRITS